VPRLAKKYFTYLGDCPAETRIVLGDARVVMEAERARGDLQRFDVLAVDAFSGDAIPIHLLTKQCGEIYRDHLRSLMAGRDWIWIAGNHDPAPPREFGGQVRETLRLGGLFFRHEPLETPEAAAPLVRALKRQGVDGLKAYFLLEPDVLAAVVAEAEVQGLPVTGHIGVRTSWDEAMDAGIDGFSHVRVWKDFLDPEVQPDGTDESLDSSRDRVSRMQADWTDIDPESEEVGALIRRLAETGTAIDPTLAIQRIPDQAREQFSMEEFAMARQSFERMQAFVRKAVEAGVPLLAGTDNVGLNNELEVYEDAGIANAAILKAATVAGARWIGAEDEFGTVEVGKRANLLLVEGDPLERIRDLREIDLVLKDGVVVFRRGN